MKRNMVFYFSMGLIVIVGLGGFAGCFKPAVVPTVNREADEATKNNTFNEYKLEYKKSFWAPKWKRQDGEYSFGQLDPVFKTYPESSQISSRIKTREAVIVILSGVSGGIFGATLGFSLGTESGMSLSQNTQIALYASAGGLLVAAILVAILWKNPVDQLADVYNRCLLNDLKLPSSP